jgi:hypothetical protein
VTILPDAAEAYVEERKILEYLLDVYHEFGGPKARFFLNHGFSRTSWETFAAALISHATRNDVVEAEHTRFGVIYEVRCALHTPDGANPCIRTIRERRSGRRPRLVTAYPF